MSKIKNENFVGGELFPPDKKEEYEKIVSEWSEIYGQFKKATEAMIQRAGGSEKVQIEYCRKADREDIYNLKLCLS